MNEKSVEQLFVELDNLARSSNLSKRETAQKLNVPYETFRKWFQKGKGNKKLSPENIIKIEKFLELQKKSTSYRLDLWMKILKWWETQHQYSALGELAEEIGWDYQNLNRHFQNKEMPAKLVVEKIAKTIGFEIPISDFILQEAQQKTEKIKQFLLFLEEELRWFRDNSKETRAIFRENLDPGDIGYISSLLTMLGDEDKFTRWLTLTTNRFNFFKKRRG
jgi:hypothetical protein